MNFADIQARHGGYDAAPPLPGTPGLACVGRIEVLGEGVEGFRVGQRVSAWTTGGSYAERVLASAMRTYPIAEDARSRRPRR